MRHCGIADDMEVGIAVEEVVGSSMVDTEAEQGVDSDDLVEGVVGELEGIGIRTLRHVDMVDNLCV